MRAYRKNADRSKCPCGRECYDAGFSQNLQRWRICVGCEDFVSKCKCPHVDAKRKTFLATKSD